MKKYYLIWLLFWKLPATVAQEVTITPATFKPTQFYIGQVLDRREQTTMGRVLDKKGEWTTLYTHEPLVRALKNSWVFPKNENRYAINVIIKTLKISESLKKDHLVSGKLQISLWFSWKRDTTEIFLTPYSTDFQYTRSINNLPDYGSLLGKISDYAFKYLNEWINRNKENNPDLAYCIRVLAQPDYTTNTPESDTVFHAERALTWDDFPIKKSNFKPSISNPSVVYAATIYSSFSYEAPTHIRDGCIEIALQVKTFMQKSMSWALPDAKNSYALNHEQLHFDITRLIAERFKSYIMGQPLSIDDYDSQIQLAFLDFYRDMTKLQKEYDTETEHGLNKTAQAQWQQRIAKQLAIYIK